MNIVSTNQEKYYFLNMCNLCRYARFSQAQSRLYLLSLLLMCSKTYHLCSFFALSNPQCKHCLERHLGNSALYILSPQGFLESGCTADYACVQISLQRLAYRIETNPNLLYTAVVICHYNLT